MVERRRIAEANPPLAKSVRIIGCRVNVDARFGGELFAFLFGEFSPAQIFGGNSESEMMVLNVN